MLLAEPIARLQAHIGLVHWTLQENDGGGETCVQAVKQHEGEGEDEGKGEEERRMVDIEIRASTYRRGIEGWRGCISANQHINACLCGSDEAARHNTHTVVRFHSRERGMGELFKVVRVRNKHSASGGGCIP